MGVRNGLFQVHWFLGITSGLVLAVVGMTGAMMSFERPIMDAISPDIVQVEVSGERLTPDAIIARFHAQRPQNRVEQITLWPEAQRSALIRVMPAPGERRGEAIYINPYTGELLGKIRGEQFFRTVRSLHRWLLIPSEQDGINWGRQITGFSAIALIFFALSGLYLRWPRRALNWRNWFRIDFSLKGRNFYWALHSVIGTWVLVVYLLLALTGLSWSYSWYKNGLSHILTGEAMQQRQGPGGPGGQRGPGGREGGREGGHSEQVQVAIDQAWSVFSATAEGQYKFASLSLPRAPRDPVMVNYVARDAVNDRQRSSMSIDARTGAIAAHQPYQPAQPLGKRIYQGLYELHTGEWFGTPGLIVNMIASLLMPLFTITGFLLYFDRRKKKKQSKLSAAAVTSAHTDADYWVVFGSQTGTAEQLAWHTAKMLQSGGLKVSVKSIASLDKPSLETAPRILFLLSTFGEGEAPDAARGFARTLLSKALSLPRLQFAVLGLGDKCYIDYCAFAEQVETWLLASGATPLFSRINVDNGDAQAINQWQQQVAQLSGIDEVATWAAPQYDEWTLQARQLLNAGSAGMPVYRVSLQGQSSNHWQAGDILEILPENQADLPHREYSIASVPTDGQLDVVVRQVIKSDGVLGLGSGWLTAGAHEGQAVLARVRTNPAFHPAAVDAAGKAAPAIFIGAGTGIAGLRAHLRHRYLHDQTQNWLVFGERHGAFDRLFGDELDAWKASGFLSELDEAYSRDGGGYVQDVLRSKQAQLTAWLNAGAVIYVCGGMAMGKGVHEALLALLGEEALQQLVDSQRYKRDVY